MPDDPDRPRVLVDTATLPTGADASGPLWTLDPGERDLDANVIRLRPGTSVDVHDGPEVDVLICVVAGAGRVVTDAEPVEVGAGMLVWLPRRARRGITAGPDGLSYLTVHRRRAALVLDPPGPRPA